MSSPRDRDGSDDGGDWREPAHLSGDEPVEPNFADRRKKPRDEDPPPTGRSGSRRAGTCPRPPAA